MDRKTKDLGRQKRNVDKRDGTRSCCVKTLGHRCPNTVVALDYILPEESFRLCERWKGDGIRDFNCTCAEISRRTWWLDNTERLLSGIHHHGVAESSWPSHHLPDEAGMKFEMMLG